MLQAYRVLARSSRHAYHSQNPLEGTGNSAIILLPGVEHPKVIELGIPWRALVVAYLFRALEILMTRSGNSRGQ